MQVIKKIKVLLSIFALVLILAPNANSTEECFEGTSRAIFKFNMALDDIIKESNFSAGPINGGGKMYSKGGGGRGSRKQASAPYGKGRGGGGGGAKACNNCGEIGHLAGQCPEPAQCHACGSTAHAVADCPNKDKTCDICGKVGHLKVKCRMGTR